MKHYPDSLPILKAKAQRRRELAGLPWEQKIAIMKRMQTLLPANWWERNVRSVAGNSTKQESQGHS